MRLAGIDLGIHKIAISLFDGEKLIHALPHQVNAAAPRDIQLMELAGFAHDVCLSHDVASVWIEDVIIGNNRKYSLQLAQTLGSVLNDLAHLRLSMGTDIRTVDNKAWKKVVVGNGNANKDSVRDYIHVTHPSYAQLCDGDQDLYDATCVGLYGLHTERQAVGLQLG